MFGSLINHTSLAPSRVSKAWGRALGLFSDCLVEVDAYFMLVSHDPWQGIARIRTSAVFDEPM